MTLSRGTSRLFWIVFGLVLLILFLRKPDTLTSPQFWAEDALVFLRLQVLSGARNALATPHSGYLQFLPRLVAAIASPFPFLWQPFLYNACALLLAALSCALFSRNSYRHLLPSDLMRAAVCLVTAGVLFSDELLGTITNIQWYLTIPILLLLFRRPPKEARPSRLAMEQEVSLAVVEFAFVLSCPLAVILVPVALWQVFSPAAAKARNSLAPRLVSWALLLAATMQMLVRFADNASASAGGTSLPGPFQLIFSMAVGFVYRVVLTTVAGYHAAQAVAGSTSPVPALIALSAVLGWMALLWFRRRELRPTLLVLLYLVAASLALPFVIRAEWRHYSALTSLADTRGERYFFLSGFLLVYLAALTLGASKLSNGWRIAVLVLIFAGGAVGNFAIHPMPDLHWRTYAAELEVWRQQTRAGIPTQGLAVPVNPGMNWIAHFPDTRIDGVLARVGDGVVREAAAGGQPGGRVYLIEGGKKRLIPDESWISQVAGQSPESVRPATAQDLNVLPTGPPVGRASPLKADQAGIFRQSLFWLLDRSGGRNLESALGSAFPFVPGDVPVVGDWNGSGTTKVGVYRSDSGFWILDYNGNGVFDGPTIDRVYHFGQPGDIPITGDWNGSGKTSIGVFRQGTWILDYNGNGYEDYPGDASFEFGRAGDTPVAGDWNGSGTTKVGAYRDGAWVLDVTGRRSHDPAVVISDPGNDVAGELTFRCGAKGDVPVVGDWTGQGKARIGVVRNLRLWILDADGDGRLSPRDPTFSFGGVPGDKPVVGRW